MTAMTDLALDGLSPRAFKRLAEFIQGYCGIKMPPSKKTMLEGRLRRRARALGLDSLNAYADFLFDHGGLDGELVHLIDSVTTNKTDFFREPEHFRYLYEAALPQLAERGAGQARPLTVWSAAASIGAEAYTLAMVLAEFAGHRAGNFRFQVLATDICTEVLETAVAAIYPEEMVAPVPPELRHRYLMRSKDRRHPTVRVRPELRRHVGFAHLNLVEGPYDLDLAADVVFCRNILIYFDKPTQQRVLENLCRHLVPGGYLFIGHSETLAGCDLPLRQVATTIFQRE